MDLKNKKIFLCKKIKRSKTNKKYIFDICKDKRNKNEFCEDNLSLITHYKNQLNEKIIFKKETFFLIDDILVPSFFKTKPPFSIVIVPVSALWAIAEIGILPSAAISASNVAAPIENVTSFKNTDEKHKNKIRIDFIFRRKDDLWFIN